jgi:hypothetical protein
MQLRREVAMYVTIRTYGLKQGSAEELARRMQHAFVPRIAACGEPQEYFVVDSGGGHLTTIALFEDEAAAIRAAAQTSEWVTAQVADLAAGPPASVRGEVVVHHGGVP